jgi:hypothetical protein
VNRTIIALSVATLLALGPAAASTSAEAHPRHAPDTSVAEWDAIGARAFTAASLSPAEGHMIFAYVSVAVYDSVMAIERDHDPFAVKVRAPRDASAPAAVAAAAHRVLTHYLPAQATTILDPAFATFVAAIPDGPAKEAGLGLGQRVADALIAQRADDGFRAPATYTPPNPPVAGVWLPTAATNPIGVYLGNVRPFVLRSADQFRPSGPPALGSRAWAREYQETQSIGSSTSTTRTAEQSLAARFWGEPPVQQARGSFRAFVLEHGLDVSDAARFMVMISVTYADALIACFDAKYHFAFWRPVTAIRAGDTDGNPRTTGDPSWSPMLPATPNHPEYPSAHSCITPAGGLVIAKFLGTKRIDFTVPSLTGLGDRHYATVADLRTEVSNARIWGGIHFRSAVVDGATIATKTATYVLGHAFESSRGDD